MAVESFNYKGVMPVKRLNDDGTYTKMAFPEMNGKLAKMIKKRKKWKPSTSGCSGSECSLFSTKKLSTTSHTMVWVYENDEWYVYNPESMLGNNKERIKLYE